MKKIVILTLFAAIFISCTQEVKLSKLNKEQNIKPGEWFDTKDSLSGISVREDKMAFFKKMQFSGDDICHYSIIDSIKKAEQKEIKFGEYLLLKGYTDTIQYEIIKRNDSFFSLKMNNEIRKFKWKKFIVFHDK
jgi:hypothetical protein